MSIQSDISQLAAANLPGHFSGDNLTALKAAVSAANRSNKTTVQAQAEDQTLSASGDGIELDADNGLNTVELHRRSVIADLATAVGSYRLSAADMKFIDSLIN